MRFIVDYNGCKHICYTSFKDVAAAAEKLNEFMGDSSSFIENAKEVPVPDYWYFYAKQMPSSMWFDLKKNPFVLSPTTSDNIVVSIDPCKDWKDKARRIAATFALRISCSRVWTFARIM